MLQGIFGSGKSFVTINWACEQFDNNNFSKIVVTRNISHLNDVCGFLPGDINEKMTGFFAQQIQYMKEFFGPERYLKLIREEKIELLPIGMVRGRSFDSSIVILDEAQNASKKDVMDLLTRIGRRSKIVVMGDFRQNDFEGVSFFEQMVEHFEDEDVGFVELTEEDVQRHKSLVRWYKKLMAIGKPIRG